MKGFESRTGVFEADAPCLSLSAKAESSFNRKALTVRTDIALCVTRVNDELDATCSVRSGRMIVEVTASSFPLSATSRRHVCPPCRFPSCGSGTTACNPCRTSRGYLVKYPRTAQYFAVIPVVLQNFDRLWGTPCCRNRDYWLWSVRASPLRASRIMYPLFWTNLRQCF